MRLEKYSCFSRKRILFTLLSSFLFFMASALVMAQVKPPRPINVTVTQNLGFGTFYHGVLGGSVSVSPAGVRSATGDVVLLVSGLYFAAVYRITGPPGTVVSLLNGPDVLLAGSGGGSLSLHIGNSIPASPFVLTPGPFSVNVGGTLTVGNSAANPPGSYSGTFNITFVQE
jgi:hypothetical protein